MKIRHLFVARNERRTQSDTNLEDDSRCHNVGTNTKEDESHSESEDTTSIKSDTRSITSFSSLKIRLKRKLSLFSSYNKSPGKFPAIPSSSMPRLYDDQLSNNGYLEENYYSEPEIQLDEILESEFIDTHRYSWASDGASDGTLKANSSKESLSSLSTLTGYHLHSTPLDTNSRQNGHSKKNPTKISKQLDLSPIGTPVPKKGSKMTKSKKKRSSIKKKSSDKNSPSANDSLGVSTIEQSSNALTINESSQCSPTASSVSGASGDSGVATSEDKKNNLNVNSLKEKYPLTQDVFANDDKQNSCNICLKAKKTSPELPKHLFKSKKLKKARPCHVCHQPVIKVASCCRVCKYLVHQNCEPKNNNDVSQVNKAKVTVVKSNPVPLTSSSSVAKYGISERKMDLVYVTERIISVVFTVDADGAKYVSCIRDVAHMLSSKHGDNFRVFDLSQDSEVSKYLPRVTSLGWANGLAPPLERLCSVCKALESWLNEHPQHVALLHSRNGYEKLGVVVAAYMHYSNICASTDQALDRYAMKRFFDDKIGQLKLPSQKRYVQYFAGLLSGAIRINSSPLYLHTVTLYGSPHFEPRGGCSLFIKIYQGMTPVYTSGVYNLTETMRHVTIAFETGVQLRGDILLKAYHRRLNPASREIIFRLQFHTCAVSERVLPFSRQEIDDACDDLRFPLDGGLELSFSQTADDKSGLVSNVSCDKTPCAITAWNSYEKLSHILNTSEDHGVISASVSHTLGPLDGSLYATVNKKRASLTPTTPPAPTPSPHGPNGRYAASIDSGIASNNSAVPAPISPPTSNSSRASAESRGTAPVAAPSPRPTTAVGSSRVSARQLDELLAGMLLDIQSIPDLRPCQTPAPDIDSIRCPDFGSSKLKGRAQRNGSTSSAQNGFSGSSTHDSFMDASFSTNTDDVPYHARTDSKPFSYGAVTSSPLPNRHKHAPDTIDGQALPPSPSIHRKTSRDTLASTRAGLESPRLIRKMPGVVGTSEGSRRSASRSPSPDTGSRGGTMRRERANTVTTRIMSGEPSPPSTLTRSTLTRSAGKLEDPFDDSFSHDSLSRSYGSNMSNMSWLQMQQRKLQERRHARHRAERGPHEANVLSELRSRMMQQNHQGKEFEDGYVSDTTLLSDASRESSPTKSLHPLTINTNSAGLQKEPQSATINSAPSSPIMPQRANLKQVQYVNTKNVSRKYSDGTHDRERPFVAVKRLHETNRANESSDPNAALSQLQTSPLGHIIYSSYNTTSNKSDGLLTTIHQSPSQNTQYRKRETSRAYNTMPITKNEEASWMSDAENYVGHRPITPGFPPDTPTTPYLNQGLPPKSPTSQRKEIGGLRSPSPATSQHRHELNGHSSPAPSLYYGQSRRSSLTSLNDSGDVISSHPKFVKDISKFWYKPNITRDEAINMLRQKSPGTFVVRDSNSFPGAFGLALKVSTPPPNIANKSTDPSSELVRHFLIEPTSKGVRLKGCANEPVFGSLSALVYQHSITSLALPCRLTLPDRDPIEALHTTDSTLSSTRNETVQLLHQGAACNVLYLYSTDTESLTGPQAVKRAVLLMLATTTNPTVVHFKVSSQGITLTDNTRQLFFRRHYPVSTISHCGLDPDDRRWAQRNEEGVPIGSLRIFGFVAKKGSSRTDNQCHVLAELDPEQPASAICNFVTKVMMTSVNRFNLV